MEKKRLGKTRQATDKFLNISMAADSFNPQPRRVMFNNDSNMISNKSPSLFNNPILNKSVEANNSSLVKDTSAGTRQDAISNSLHSLH